MIAKRSVTLSAFYTNSAIDPSGMALFFIVHPPFFAQFHFRRIT